MKPTCFGIVPLATGIQLLVIGYIFRAFVYSCLMARFLLYKRGFMVEGPIEPHMFVFFWILFVIDLFPFYGLRYITPFLRRDNIATRHALWTAFTIVWII